MTSPEAGDQFLALGAAIGKTHTDPVVISTKLDGVFEAQERGEFAHVVSPAMTLPGNVFFSVQPIVPPERGRGRVDDIVGFITLFADLDAVRGKLESLANCEAVISELCRMLSAEPAAVVNSGHGLQPYWALVGEGTRWEIDDQAARLRAKALLARFGELVERAAVRVMGETRAERDAVDGFDRPPRSSVAWVDKGVYELARVLRVPGTTNYKQDPPVPAVLERVTDQAQPLTLVDLEAILDEHLGDLDSRSAPSSSTAKGTAACSAEDDLERFKACLEKSGIAVAEVPAAGYLDEVEYRSTCPAHGRDGEQHSTDALSFGISVRDDEPRFVWYCHGGCSQQDVVDAIGFALSPPPAVATGGLLADLGLEVIAELAGNQPLREEVSRLRVQERAKQILHDARSAVAPAPDVASLAEILQRPDRVPYRISELLPWQGRMLLTAQRKAGKTTTAGNMAFSLLTGEPFLGAFSTTPIDGSVVMLNFEVHAQMIAGWMADIGVPPDRMTIVSLRGSRNLLQDSRGRQELVELVKRAGCEVLMVDPFGRAFTGKDQNNAAEVAAWLGHLDDVANRAGCSELILTAHAGWDGGRTRGSSALEDWPDSILTLTRDDKTDLRYIKADGRDVRLSQQELQYDEISRRLTLSGQGSVRESRASQRIDRLADVICQIVSEQPGINVDGLRTALKQAGEHFQRADVNAAAALASMRGLIHRERGPRGAWLHHPTTSTDTSPAVPGTGGSSPVPSYKDGTAAEPLSECRQSTVPSPAPPPREDREETW